MPVGKTKDVGWQIGVSRALSCTVEQAWALLTSEAGMAIWLGVGAVLKAVPGAAYTAADGTAGEVRSFRPYDRIRLTWRPPSWPHDSTVQVAISGGSRSTTVRFHQERLANSTERERQRDHWRAVLDPAGGPPRPSARVTPHVVAVSYGQEYGGDYG